MNTDVLGEIISMLNILTDKETFHYLAQVHKLTEGESKKVYDFWLKHSKVECKHANGAKLWYVNGILHREGGLPAVEYANGTKEWYVNGELHREGGLPAVEWADGRKEWYVNGKYIRRN